MRELLKARLKAAGVAAEAEQVEKLAAFHALLIEANARMNLTRVSADPAEAIDRNYLDSLAPLPHLFGAKTCVDVGSGCLLYTSVQARIGQIAHALADDMAGHGLHDQAVLFEIFLDPGDVTVVGKRLVDVDAVAPAGHFEAVIAHLFGQDAQFVEGQIRPLSGTQRYRSGSHNKFLLNMIDLITNTRLR